VVLEDQEFDIASFRKLRELIIPSLGSEAVPEQSRRAYAEGLFRTSIIHAPAPAEASIIFRDHNANTTGVSDVLGLAELYKPRDGRTVDPSPAQRAKMSYVCLDELFSLVAAHDEASAAPMILVQPPTPRHASHFPTAITTATKPPSSSASPNGNNNNTAAGDGSRPQETAHALHVRLARTAALYLILRCALSLRAYVADQPLRGRMPQPLSQRRELARILSWLVALRSEPDAIPDTANVESEGRKHLLRLYPLLVDAARVAGRCGDEEVLGVLGEALGVVGGELGL
jgi:hypothetical protein